MTSSSIESNKTERDRRGRNNRQLDRRGFLTGLGALGAGLWTAPSAEAFGLPEDKIKVVRNDLSDFKLVKDALGGTVNDVVLTAVSGGLQKWLRSRGTRTEETYDADGGLQSRTSSPFATTFAVRQVTGGRWLNVGELPYGSDGS